MTWCYKVLENLPQVPPDIVAKSLAKVIPEVPDNNQNFSWKARSEWKYQENGKEKLNAACLAYDLDPEVIEWFENNIVSSGYTNIRICSTSVGDGKCAHTDTTKDALLMYNLDTGGENVATTFFQEPGHPILRERGISKFNHDELIEIDRVVAPQNTWVLLHGNVLHGVDHLDRSRVAFHIGLKKPLPEFIEKFI